MCTASCRSVWRLAAGQRQARRRGDSDDVAPEVAGLSALTTKTLKHAPVIDRLTLRLVNTRVFDADDFHPHATTGSMYLKRESLAKYFTHYEAAIGEPGDQRPPIARVGRRGSTDESYLDR
jgi:hypothetical protein